MIFDNSLDITAYASFTVSGVRANATPLPTVSVFRNGTQVINDDDAISVGDGTFKYTLPSLHTANDGSYLFSFFLTGSDQLVINIEHQVSGQIMDLYSNLLDAISAITVIDTNVDTLLTNLATVDGNVDDIETDVESIGLIQGSLPTIPDEGPFGRVVYPRGRNV